MKRTNDANNSVYKALVIAVAAATVTSGALAVRYFFHGQNENKNSPQAAAVQQQAFNYVATVYQSKTDRNNLIVKINSEWFKYTQTRIARNGEGALSPIPWNIRNAYGDPLVTRVLEHAYPNGFPGAGKPLFTLTPTETVQSPKLAEQYQRIAVYGTNDPRFNVVTELSDFVR